MRSRSEQLERLVCAEHCRFFKPWEETHRCAAYQWLDRRVQEDGDVMEHLHRLRGRRPPPVLRHDDLLSRTQCARCGYFPDGCRYRDPSRNDGPGPCGGLVAVDMLLDRDALDEGTLSCPTRAP